MKKATSTPKNGVQASAELPIIYADALLTMSAGAYTSRIVLSVQDNSESHQRPTTVLVMPTQAMFGMAIHIIATLTGGDNVAQMRGLHETLTNLLGDPVHVLRDYAKSLEQGPAEEGAPAKGRGK